MAMGLYSLQRDEFRCRVGRILHGVDQRKTGAALLPSLGLGDLEDGADLGGCGDDHGIELLPERSRGRERAEKRAGIVAAVRVEERRGALGARPAAAPAGRDAAEDNGAVRGGAEAVDDMVGAPGRVRDGEEHDLLLVAPEHTTVDLCETSPRKSGCGDRVPLQKRRKIEAQ